MMWLGKNGLVNEKGKGKEKSDTASWEGTMPCVGHKKIDGKG